MSEQLAQPVDTSEEEFVVGGDAGNNNKSKYDFEGTFKVEFTALKGQVSKTGKDMVVATVVGQTGPATGLIFTDYLLRFKLEQLFNEAGIKYRVTDDEKLAFKASDVIGLNIYAKFKRELYAAKNTWSAKIQGYTTQEPEATGVGDDQIPF